MRKIGLKRGLLYVASQIGIVAAAIGGYAIVLQVVLPVEYTVAWLIAIPFVGMALMTVTVGDKILYG